jgi:sulfite reductase (ferredoxin)
MTSWKERLGAEVPDDWAAEIDGFESQMQLRKQGKIDEKVFAELRLRRGAYGQRYDNGRRHDGEKTQEIAYPTGQLLKGPNTLWDAPGMHRIKVPYGKLSARQLEVLADVSEEYSDGISHVTTRQDIQLHFVHIEDTPDLMRRLAAVGITTREACGNTVRNVTACPIAGICKDEAFDVTPYAHATAFFLLGHPDTQDFGRKFKIAFSGCRQHACGLASMHDIGAIAAVRDGARGFAYYVGGGLGAVPYQAKLLYDFLPETEILPVAQAIGRVFARLGEKKNRARARLKFLVAKLGFEEFKRLVEEERQKLTRDERWTSFLSDLGLLDDKPLRPPAPLGPGPYPEGFSPWRATNVQGQKQPGYAAATITLPLGDATASQMRAIADICRTYTGDNLRTTVEQNMLLRWVPEADLPAVYKALKAVGLGAPGAGTIADVTACPGTDTCKLGISSSRGLASELQGQLAGQLESQDPVVRDLRIKVSGCFNACGQHHVADLGFLGVSRKVGGFTVPHFQVVLGGQWTENAGAFGLAIGAIPSKRIPQVVERMTQRYVKDKREGESFQAFIKRIGKLEVKTMLEDLTQVPPHSTDASLYSDWNDPRKYSIDDMGDGECAGEVVTPAEFGLAQSEREVFEAQLMLDKGDLERAAATAYRAMISAAKAVTLTQVSYLGDSPDEVVREFRTRLVDPGLFDEAGAGPKFAPYLLSIHGQPPERLTAELVHQRVEEAQLFIEAAHGCHVRLSQRAA